MERNLKLYPWFQACASLHFWLPIFFLYFLSVLSVKEVLILEAIYYWGVVVLEVPSGYFSDRVGRRITLLIAGAAWTGAYVLFALTPSFAMFVVAQLLLAVGMAFKSGTDSSILFDSVKAEKRSEKIGDYEAKANSYGFIAAAVAALAGGLLAGFDLRLAYLLSAVGGVLAFLVAWRMTEPPSHREEAESAFLGQVAVCIKQLRNPVLLWVSLFLVAMTVFNHVPYEFFQSYLDLLLQRLDFKSVNQYSVTPAVASIHVALTMLIASWASRHAMRLQKTLGVAWALLATMLLQGAIIFSMTAVLHPLVVVLLLLRSTPRALMAPIISATVHPHLESGLRATFLSLQSFAGRLLFGAALFTTFMFTRGLDTLTADNLASILTVYALIVVGVLLMLSLSARFLVPTRRY